MAKPVPRLSPEDVASVIAIAWDDKPPFPEVLRCHGLSPGQIVQLLKRELTPNAFKVWMARTRAPNRPMSARGPAAARGGSRSGSKAGSRGGSGGGSRAA